MSNSQRWLSISFLALIAGILASHFLQIGSNLPASADPSWPTNFLGFGEELEGWALLAAPGKGEYAALIGGIVFPLGLIAAAAFLWLGRQRSVKLIETKSESRK